MQPIILFLPLASFFFLSRSRNLRNLKITEQSLAVCTQKVSYLFFFSEWWLINVLGCQHQLNMNYLDKQEAVGINLNMFEMKTHWELWGASLIKFGVDPGQLIIYLSANISSGHRVQQLQYCKIQCLLALSSMVTCLWNRITSLWKWHCDTEHVKQKDWLLLKSWTSMIAEKLATPWTICSETVAWTWLIGVQQLTTKNHLNLFVPAWVLIEKQQLWCLSFCSCHSFQLVSFSTWKKLPVALFPASLSPDLPLCSNACTS